MLSVATRDHNSSVFSPLALVLAVCLFVCMCVYKAFLIISNMQAVTMYSQLVLSVIFQWSFSVKPTAKHLRS